MLLVNECSTDMPKPCYDPWCLWARRQLVSGVGGHGRLQEAAPARLAFDAPGRLLVEWADTAGRSWQIEAVGSGGRGWGEIITHGMAPIPKE
jgi:hypothetical protein